jgi:hypothetical protein
MLEKSHLATDTVYIYAAKPEQLEFGMSENERTVKARIHSLAHG